MVSSLPKFLFPKSFVTDFTIHNLPYGVFRPRGCSGARIGVAIGDRVLDLTELSKADKLDPSLQSETLNDFMAAGKTVWDETRRRVTNMLTDGHAESLENNESLLTECLYNQSGVQMLLPAKIGDYTDFYASREHATNVGSMFRDPANALFPNWLHIPIGYHGRSSSVVVSGTDLRRPLGQTLPAGATDPIFGPSQLVDIELEMAMFVGPGNKLGERITIENAADHMFGVVLMNDWSARDIQKWEYVPLGPFLGKSFGTTISPWVVPFAALEPFRTTTPPMQKGEHPLDYIKHAEGDKPGFDINLEVSLKSSKTGASGVLCRSNLKHMWWSFAQMLTHHTANGCNLRPGDMLATGTISGPTEDSYGSMLELSWAGKKDIPLSNGETRKFLKDNDVITITGYCEKDDIRVGFGTCEGELLPAKI